MNAAEELKGFIDRWAPSLRRRRLFGDLLKAEVAQEIAGEVVAERHLLSRTAYAAQQADEEAARLIGLITADGHLTDSELPLLTKALRNITRSARHDGNLCDRLAN